MVLSVLVLLLLTSRAWIPGGVGVEGWEVSVAQLQKHHLEAFFFFLIYLFIYFWLHWVFVAARGLSLVAASRGSSSLQCTGFSLRWLLLLRSMGSRRAGFSSCDLQALERRLSNCGARA